MEETDVGVMVDFERKGFVGDVLVGVEGVNNGVGGMEEGSCERSVEGFGGVSEEKRSWEGEGGSGKEGTFVIQVFFCVLVEQL